MDGVFGHHTSSGEELQRTTLVLEALKSLIRRASDENLSKLVDAVADGPTLGYIDVLLPKISAELLPRERVKLAAIGRYFVTRSAQREATKFGIALLGITGSDSDVELFTTVGSHSEFTLYSAVALNNLIPEADKHLWRLAQNVTGWGRVQAVERLVNTTNPEIQAWLIGEGFRNAVMDEYLACICARTGQLHVALSNNVVDVALLNGAADILRALIAGGPAEGIDDYEHAAGVAELYLNHVWARNDLDLRHYLSVKSLREFMDTPDGWENREAKGWTPTLRTNLVALCDEILSRSTWRDLALHALSSNDNGDVWMGDRVARDLGIDTWELLFQRIRSEPLTSWFWYQMLEQTDEFRIQEVVTFAEQILPLDQIATGPADESGLGKDFLPHHALDWILQAMERFPGHGWSLIKAGLQSPVVRNRNMALKAFSLWHKKLWASDAIPLIETAISAEPRDDLREQMKQLLCDGKS